MTRLTLERSQDTLDHAEAIVQSVEFRKLYALRERVRWGLTAVAFLIASLFAACMAFAPEFISRPLTSETAITWGFVMMVASLILGTAVAGIYVLAAEHLLGPEALRRKHPL